MVTCFDIHIWDSSFQKHLLFHQRCWIVFFPPHEAWLQLIHPEQCLLRPTFLLTLRGFPSAQTVVSGTYLRQQTNKPPFSFVLIVENRLTVFTANDL